MFRIQQIHQKIETGQIREIEVNSNTATVSVEKSQVLRTGGFKSTRMNNEKSKRVFSAATDQRRYVPQRPVSAGCDRLQNEV